MWKQTKRVGQTLATNEENILFECREDTGQCLFQFLCRPLNSNHFIWLKMLMKFDETVLNTK